jgi:predicted hotdog family 3-hydroxylacyl-ACP dehydratase
MIANQDSVKNLIPQKAPFVMVDELMAYTEERLHARFTVNTENLFVYKDHFQESGIIEHMAQSVALHTGYQFFLINKPAPTGYLGSIKNIEITRLPKLDEVLDTTVAILQEFMGITLVEIEVKINDELIAKGQMKTVLAKEE